METSLERIQEEFQVPIGIDIEGIAKGASLIPSIAVNDAGITEDVIFCEAMSGGADEVNNMPRTISLTRYKWIDGVLHEYKGTYTLTSNR